MAYKTIGTYKVYEHEQQEITQTNLVGEVTVIQPYVHIWADLTVFQEVLENENRSNIKANLTLHGTAGENSSGFTIETWRSMYSDNGCAIRFGGSYHAVHYSDSKNKTLTVAPGETKSLSVMNFDTLDAFYSNYTVTTEIDNIYHNFDGSLTHFQTYVSGVMNYYKDEPIFDVKTYFYYTGNYNGTEVEEKTLSATSTGILPSYISTNRGLIPTTATSFTDEENPSFTYSIPSGQKFAYYPNSKYDDFLRTDTVTSIYVALSLDGETPDIEYREIPINGTNYTFYLTEAEREVLRQKAQGSSTVPIYYITKTAREYYKKVSSSNIIDLSQEFTHTTERNFTVIGCNPQLNPTVKDIKEETLALTGDENTFIRYESMAEYAINAVASKHATIVDQSVQCGSKIISNLPYGVIQDVESGTFIFSVTDSRAMGAVSSVFKNFIEYVKPTCYQNLEIELSGETGANIRLTTSGSYYNGSFGVADNTLLLEMRYQEGNNAMGEWTTLTGTPTFNGTTYELETLLEGFDYSKTYTFQCRATDKLNYVISSQYKITLKPIFDWNNEDFNFNVPINMNGKTVLRHNETANNTVLSASGGHVYIRPGGTDDTEGEIMIKPDGTTHFTANVEVGNTLVLAEDNGALIAGTGEEICIKGNVNDDTSKETIIAPNGDIEVNGAVNFEGNVEVNGTTTFNDKVTFSSDTVLNEYIDFSAFGDYIVETGTESMGSNGTWYWTKWASGKAECWGCRNFGKMSVSTAKGNVYRSGDSFDQSFPSGLFIATPDFINLYPRSFGDAYSYGQIWIVPWRKSVSSSWTYPTSKSYVQFAVMAPSSFTSTESYVSFHAIGRWV